MKIWTNEHVFNHNWEMLTQSQWQKYPNPHNPAVKGSDVLSRSVGADGILRSHRVLISENLAPYWVQKLIGTASECLAHEYSTVDAKTRHMELSSVNLTFGSIISMREKIQYFPHPEFPDTKTVMKQSAEVAVRGVPLTDYVESTIVAICTSNSRKGKVAMDWVTDRLNQETRNVTVNLEKLKQEIVSLTDSVAENVVTRAKKSIEDLQKKHLLQAEEFSGKNKTL